MTNTNASTITELTAELERTQSELEALMTRNGDDLKAWPAGQTERFENLSRAHDRTSDRIVALEAKRSERAAKVERGLALAQNPANLERSEPVQPRRASSGDKSHDRAARALDESHRAGLVDDYVAETLTHLLDVPGARGLDMSAWVEAAGSKDYFGAFSKRLADPLGGHLNWTPAEAEAHRNASEYARTALSLSGGSAMLPLSLDPSVALTNTGSTGGIRAVCRHETIAVASWNGVTSGGATAEWKTENAQAADGTPTIDGKAIPVQLLDIDAIVSYELEMDGLNFARELGKVLVDAAAVAVDAALATGVGAGSNQPVGIMTALTGSQDVVTGGAFAAAGVVALQNALPARFQANAKFVGSLPVRNAIGGFETTAGALRFPETTNGRLLNRPFVEDSNLATDMTTSGSRFLTYGDWSQFLCVTRTGASIDVLPNYGANGRPTASRHYFLTLRVGADALVPNGFRVLKKS